MSPTISAHTRPLTHDPKGKRQKPQGKALIGLVQIMCLFLWLEVRALQLRAPSESQGMGKMQFVYEAGGIASQNKEAKDSS